MGCQTPCPQVIPNELEKLGSATLEYVDKTGAYDPKAVDSAGHGQVKIKRADWPAGPRKPTEAELSDKSRGTDVPVYRMHRYVFDHDENECHGPLEFCTCYYKDYVSLLFIGITLEPEPRDAQGNPKPADKLHKGPSEWSGFCLDWILEKGAGAAAGAVKSHIPVSGTSMLDLGGDTLLAELGKRMSASSTGLVTLEPVFTRYAFDQINVGLAQRAGKSPVDAGKLDSMRGGAGRIDEVARELSLQRGQHATALGDLLQRVASTGLRVSGGVMSDEAWIAAAFAEAAARTSAAGNR